MTNYKAGTIKQCPEHESIEDQESYKIIKLCIISFYAGGLFVAAIFGLVIK